MRYRVWLLMVLAGTAIAVAVVVGVVTGQVSWTTTPSKSAQFFHNPITVEPESLQLGELWADEDKIVVLPLTNRSLQPVEVTSVMSSCDCGSAEPQAFRLDAGETVSITLKLRPRFKESKGATEAFEVLLNPKLADEQKADVIRLSGVIRRRYVAPPAVLLERFSSLKVPEYLAHFRLIGFEATQLSAGVGDKRLLVKASPVPRSYDWDVSVGWNPAIVPDRDLFQTDLTLKPEGEDSASGRVVVKLTLEIAEDIFVSPPQLLLVQGSTEGTFRESVQLSSLSNSQFRVESFASSDPNVRISELPGHRYLLEGARSASVSTTASAVWKVRVGGRLQEVTLSIYDYRRAK